MVLGEALRFLFVNVRRFLRNTFLLEFLTKWFWIVPTAVLIWKMFESASARKATRDREQEKKRKKKLLILDINGLFVYRQFKFAPELPPDYDASGSTLLEKTYTWKRPHTSSFIDFCFDHFDVILWSSAYQRNTDLLVNFLFTDEQKGKFLAVLSNSSCNKYFPHPNPPPNDPTRPLFTKPLSVPWKMFPQLGHNETDTLLVDDDIQKTIDSPPNTAYVVKKWSPREGDGMNDTALAPGSNLVKLLQIYSKAEMSTAMFLKALSQIKNF